MTNLSKVNLISGARRQSRNTKRCIIREYRSGDYGGISELYFRVFSKHFKEENFYWKYFQNPFAKSILLVAENTRGQICAFHGTMPFLKKTGNDEQLFYLGSDSMIAPEYRKTGLYAQMLRELETKLCEVGGYLHGFPNLQAISSIKKRAGAFPLKLTANFKVLKPISASIKSFKNCLTKKVSSDYPEILDLTYKSSSNFKQISLDDPSVSSFYNRALDKNVIHTKRTSEFFKWRYVLSPNSNYTSFGHFVNNEMTANIILRTFRLKNYKIAAIMDFAQIYNSKGLSKLLKSTMSTLRKNKIDIVYTLSKIAPEDFQELKKNRFYSTTFDWYKRQFYLGLASEFFKSARPDLAERLCPIAEEEKNWLITLGDTDLI